MEWREKILSQKALSVGGGFLRGILTGINI